MRLPVLHATPDGATPLLREEAFRQLDASGAVLIRGLPLVRSGDPPSAFSRFCHSLRLDPFESRESAAVRVSLAPGVFTANEAPPEKPIPFHHELGQCRRWPRYVIFFAQVAAPRGGWTPAAPSDLVAAACRASEPSGCAELDARGIRYVRTLPFHDDPSSPIGRSWTDVLGTRDRAEAERLLFKRGDASFCWGSGGDLTITSARVPAFRRLSGKEVFFNSAIAAREGWRDARNDPSKSVVFGDDASPLSAAASSVFDCAAGAAVREATRGSYAQGDVLLLDNHRVMHSRQPFEPPRRLLASMWGERRDA